MFLQVGTGPPHAAKSMGPWGNWFGGRSAAAVCFDIKPQVFLIKPLSVYQHNNKCNARAHEPATGP